MIRSDRLHRIAGDAVLDENAITYAYDKLGNILSKSDYADDYTYGQSPGCGTAAAGPNAVTQADAYSYGYDDNGNLICGVSHNGSLSIDYDIYNKPAQINNGGTSHFWYDADQQRHTQQSLSGITHYLGKAYERKGNVHKLYLDDYAVFTIDFTNADNTGITYFHRDRLGSIAAMSDRFGNPLANSGRGFDPFGKPREANWEDSNEMDDATGQSGDLNGFAETTRGFTAHEHLNGTDLIHMNGRAYDYNLGRFLSVDPVISFPANSQSLNPYSYIMNNPLAATDPTGYEISCNDSMTSCNFAGSDIDSAVADKNGTITATLTNGLQVTVTTHSVSNGKVVSNTSGNIEGNAGPSGLGGAEQRINFDNSASVKGQREFATDEFCDTSCEMAGLRQGQRGTVADAADAMDSIGDEIDPLNPTNIVGAAAGPAGKAGTKAAGPVARFFKRLFGRGDDVSDIRKATESTIPEGRVSHIFRNADGHLPDTPENRRLLIDVADDADTTLGTDKFGNVWSARTNADGTQVWVQTRNGEIINGGLNQTPRQFNSETGLSRLQPPSQGGSQ